MPVAVNGIFFFQHRRTRKRKLGAAKMQGTRARAHKLWADRYAMQGNAHKAAAHYKRAFEYRMRFGGDDHEQCIICLEHDPPPIQSGCACRGNAGLARADCLVKKAVSQQAQLGF